MPDVTKLDKRTENGSGSGAYSLFESDEDDALAPRENWVCEMIGVEKLEMKKREIPVTCGAWDAVVCPKRTGIWSTSLLSEEDVLSKDSGSDMHVYVEGMVGDKPFSKPFVLGHECSGIVTRVGENVRDVQPGDRVALEGKHATAANFASQGPLAAETSLDAQCESMKFAAAAGMDGTLQGYYTLPADLCYKLPDNISLEEGALMEPLSVAVNAVAHVAELRPLSHVAVFGAGPVGLLTMAAAKAFGARRIIAVDVQPARLEFAKQYLGVEVHLASPVEKGEDRGVYSRRHAEIIQEEFNIGVRGQPGIDVVLECSGAEVSVQTGLWLLRRKGKFVQVGNGALYNSIPMLMVINRELNIKGSFRYGPGTFRMAIDLVSRGMIDLKPLLTHKFSFNDAAKAFKTTKDSKGPDGNLAIKVIIEGPKV